MKKLHCIFLLFSAVFCYSQVTLVAAIDDKEYKVNQKFVFTVILQISGENMVQQTAIRLPDFSKFDRWGNGSERNTVLLDRGNVDQMVYQQVLSPKFPGEFKIGSATVTINGKIYKTEPFEIQVEEADRITPTESPTKFKNDLYLNLEIADKEVYQNEPAVAVLRAYSKNINNFRKVKNVQLPAQNNVEFSSISNKRSDIELSKNTVSSQVLAVFLIYPQKSGNVLLKPATANYSADTKKLLSNKINLKVKDLPENAPVDFKNAVGDFKINFSAVNTDKVEINKPLNLRLTISGKGNMTNLQLPTIQRSENYDVFQPKILKNIKTDETGISGEVFADYIIIPKRSGNYSIVTDAFSFFNPEDNEYTDLGAQTVDLSVVSIEEMLAERTPLERVNTYTNKVLETVDNPVITTKKMKVQQKQGVVWKILLLNLFLFCTIIGIFLLINNYQKNKKKIINSAPNLMAFSSPFSSEQTSRTQLENTFGYINRMFREKNFEEVFFTITNLDSNFKNAFNVTNNSDFAEILEKENGSKTAEEYRNLSQKIQIEKYAPIKNEEEIKEIIETVNIFYYKIAK